MPGFGAIGRFPIAGNGTGSAEFIGPDKYWQNFSLPVRFPAGLAARHQREITAPISPIISISWFNWLNEPVRTKPRLIEGLQRAHFEGFAQPVLLNWFNWLSEPVRPKPISPAALSPYYFFQPAPSPFVATGWFNWLSEPVRFKPLLITANQRAHFEGFAQPVLLNWFAWLSEPKRFKPALLVADQPFIYQDIPPPGTFSFDWYSWLSEPVRLPKGLRKDLQREEFFNTFIPVQFAAMLQALEAGDGFLGLLYSFNNPVLAKVSIRINKPPGTSSVVSPSGAQKIGIITRPF